MAGEPIAAMTMIEISTTAQNHFLRLLQSQGEDAIGIRLRAVDGGTPAADARLEFCEASDLQGDEWEIECEGFMLCGRGQRAVLRLGRNRLSPSTGGSSTARHASRARCRARMPRWWNACAMCWMPISTRRSSHGGRVSLEQVTAEGVVVLRFGGGCHGCGMADVTLKEGIEKTLLAKVPGVTAVRDVTDHASGTNPYFAAQ